MLGTNIDIFFSTSSFAQTASFWVISGSGNGTTINVIYDSQYSLNVLGNVAYQNDKPTAICRTTDVSGSTPQSLIVIGGVTYYILEVQNEGTGTTTLVLSGKSING